LPDSILIETHKNWLEITLNRPEKLNSFNEEMLVTLHKAIVDARDSGMRAILLTGAGRAFCAGQDLGDRDPRKMKEAPDLSQTIGKFYNPLVRLIRSLECPVICAVNGVAAGAGANIALACDIVLAAESAKFIQPFANIGLVPDSGGTWMLPHLIGEARAKALALTGEPVLASKAADWGMIWKSVSGESLMGEARNLTAKLANGPSIGLGHTKHAIQLASTNTFDEQLELESQLQKICGKTPDYAEGVAAFMEKRAAVFTGKKS